MNADTGSANHRILKICFVIPVYSLFSFLSVCFPKAAVFLEPWQAFYESLALGYFFLLLNEWISPSDSQRDLFFSALRVPQKNDAPPLGGLEWYRVCIIPMKRFYLLTSTKKKKWIFIFQYPVVALGVAVATDITQAAGIYCESSNKPYFAHLWVYLPLSYSTLIKLG
jgi:hypothetical protein